MRSLNALLRVALISMVLEGPLVSVSKADDADADKVERGRYLVEEVARCQDCHTPRLKTGELDKANWLKGATLDFQPMNPVPKWHAKSPDLTASGRLMQRWGEKGLTEFLKTGLGPTGNTADPPMPRYKLKADDADAIVAYLKTLK